MVSLAMMRAVHKSEMVHVNEERGTELYPEIGIEVSRMRRRTYGDLVTSPQSIMAS